MPRRAPAGRGSQWVGEVGEAEGFGAKQLQEVAPASTRPRCDLLPQAAGAPPGRGRGRRRAPHATARAHAGLISRQFLPPAGRRSRPDEGGHRCAPRCSPAPLRARGANALASRIRSPYGDALGGAQSAHLAGVERRATRPASTPCVPACSPITNSSVPPTSGPFRSHRCCAGRRRRSPAARAVGLPPLAVERRCWPGLIFARRRTVSCNPERSR